MKTTIKDAKEWEIIRQEMEDGEVISERVVEQFEDDRPHASVRLQDAWVRESFEYDSKFSMVEHGFDRDSFWGVPVGHDKCLRILLRVKK